MNVPSRKASLTLCLILTLCFCAAGEDSTTETDRQRQTAERFWTLLEKTPRRGTALDRVYAFYVETGQVDELLDRCRKRTEAAPDDAGAQLLLGLVLSRSGRDEEALKAFEQAAALGSDDPLAAFHLGEAQLAAGRLRDAIQTLETALTRALAATEGFSGRDMMTLLQTLGRVYERFGDRAGAARTWDRFERLFPDDADVRLRIAETLEEEGRWDEALLRYQKLAADARDEFDRVRFALTAAGIKIRLGDKTSALADYERLLDGLSGESWLTASIRDRLERIFTSTADDRGLDEYYRKRLETHPGELDTIRRRAVVLVRLSKTDEAKKILTAALDRAPSSVPLRLALIDLLVRDKDFAAAAVQYEKIDEIEPGNTDHLTQWGLVTLENTRLDEPQRKAAAVKIWSRIAKPGDAASVVTVADLLGSAGITDEAEAFYRRAVELRPDDPGFLEYLGYFYHRQKRKDDAVETFRKITEGNRRNAASLSQVAGIFRSLGYADEALAAFREAIDVSPDDFDLRMQCANLLLDAEKYDEAEREFRAAETLLEGRLPDEETVRFLRDYSKWLQAADRLEGEIERLQVKPDPSATDLWRLAVYQAAMNRKPEAVASIDRALKLLPDSVVLLDAAAGIFLGADEKQRALEVYRRLSETDLPRRVDHLRRLANLHRELGDTEKALETARLAMAVGAGNPANARFYAEMLLAAKRYRQGIEVLQRAVRLDPSDEVTLSMLAGALFDADRTDEAIEIGWRLFEKTDDLQNKLGTVSRLSTYYQKKRLFDQLLRRLRGLSSTSRRESAFCVAQAFISVSDYAQARKTLETLLSEVNDRPGDDPVLLSQLSRIAELQNDIPAAIRYQEMLCEADDSVEEATRLLTLYRLGGIRDRAVDHLLRNLAERGKLADQLNAIDEFLAREEYASARRLLDRVATKNPEHWEIRYRQLMLEFWHGDLDAAEKHAAALLALNRDRDEASEAVLKKGRTARQNTAPVIRTGVVSIVPADQIGWQFEQAQTTSGFESEAMSGVEQRWNRSHSQLLKTIFREKLEYFPPPRAPSYGRSTPTSAPSPQIPPPKQVTPKPQFAPENFGEARFAATVWRFRITLQRDMDDGMGVETKPPHGSFPYFQPLDGKGLNVERTLRFLADLRYRLPVDSPDNRGLNDRMRFESFFTLLYETATSKRTKFTETQYLPLVLDGLLEEKPSAGHTSVWTEAGKELRSRLAYELALRGVADWYPVACRQVLKELYAEYMVEEIPALGQDREVVEKFTAAMNDSAIREIFSSTDIEHARNSFFRSLQQVRIDTVKKSNTEERLELLRRCWDEIDRRTFEQRPGGVMDLFIILQDYPYYIRILRQRGLTAEWQRSKEILKKLSPHHAWIRAVRADAELNELFENDVEIQADSLASLIDLVRFHQYTSFYPLFIGGSPSLLNSTWQADRVHPRTGTGSAIYDIVKGNERNVRSDPEGRRFEKFTAFVETMKDEALAEFRLGKPGIPSVPFQLDALFAKYLEARLYPLRDRLSRQMGGDLRQSSRLVIGNMIVTYPYTPQSGSPVSRTVDAEFLENALAAGVEIHRVVDTWFDFMDDVDGATALTSAVSQTGSKHRPLLARFQKSFDRIDDDKSRRQMIRSPVSLSASPEMTLMKSTDYFKAFDMFLATAKPEGEIEPERLKMRFEKDFEKYLEVRYRLGTDSEGSHVQTFRWFRSQFARQPQARFTGEPGGEHPTVPLADLIAGLEADVRQARENGEPPDPRKLVMLAVQEKRRSRFDRAVEYLDAVPLDEADTAERRIREYWILSMFNLAVGSESLKPRTERALEFFRAVEPTTQELLLLNSVQNLLGRVEEMEKSRDQLIRQATDLKTKTEVLIRFQNEAAKRNPKVIEFAVQTFWDPKVQRVLDQWNMTGNETRQLVLDIVAEAGRLEDLIEQAEKKLNDSEGDIETMISLAELYFRAGYREKLEAIVRKIDEDIGGPQRDTWGYRGYLQRTNMHGTVDGWRKQKAAKEAADRLERLADTPQELLKNLEKEAADAEVNFMVPRFFEILRKNDAEPLARQFGNFRHYLERWLNRSATGMEGKELLAYLWAMEKSDEKDRREIRADIVTGISHRTEQTEYYPMFRDVVLDFLRTGEPSHHMTHQGRKTFDPFRITVYGLDRGFSIVVTLIDVAEKANRLTELRDELEKLPNSAGTHVLLAMCEARLGRAEPCLEHVRQLDRLREDATIRRATQSAMLGLAQELVALDAAEALDRAEKILSREMNDPDADNRLERVVKNCRDRIREKTKAR